MSLASLLIHSAILQRPTTRQDGRGKTVAGEPLFVARIVCRLVVRQQTVQQADAAERAVITSYKLLVPASTDIRQGDQVVDVQTRGGQMLAKHLMITSVLPRSGSSRHHISCDVEKVVI